MLLVYKRTPYRSSHYYHSKLNSIIFWTIVTVIWKKYSMCLSVCIKIKAQKNIFYKTIIVMLSTLNEGLILDVGCLSVVKETDFPCQKNVCHKQFQSFTVEKREVTKLANQNESPYFFRWIRNNRVRPNVMEHAECIICYEFFKVFGRRTRDKWGLFEERDNGL